MNAAISPITYTPGNGATGATVTGLPAGITGSYAGGIFTITGSSAIAGTYNYTVTTVGGCSTASLNGIIQVTPNVTVTRTSAAGTDAQQVCVVQQALVNITYAVGNGATGASVVAGTLPIGISQSFSGGVLTISGTPTESGTFTYTVTTTGGCGVATATGTIRVNPLPVITLPQGFICVDQSGNPLPGSNYLLTTGLNAANHTFQWSDVSGPILTATGSSYLAEAPGTYTVAVTNNLTGCYNTGSTTIITSFPPQVVKASASLYFAEDQSVSVAVLPVGNYEYQLDNGQWQDSNQFHNLSSGYHTITVRDKVGCGELSTEIRIIDYPKFFTPNNDGYNDTWNISDLSDQPLAKIEIFDRYGKLLKEISPQGAGWNGMMNGYPLPSTDYWFKVHYSDENGNMTEFKAHFSLKR
ncbi:T9SS type B sorting domain-containing protein [Flavobacterium sp.]|uniref:T9SS type B sorting domain-containing protein n=1 Tax=Flavobacterium sp. TaxID=239 RepID=UPI0039E43132